MKPFWDLGTLCFYLFLAFFGMICMYYTRKFQNGKKEFHFYKNTPACVWLFVWTFFAVFRLVRFGIGGSDAVDYIAYFEICNKPLDETDGVLYHTGSDLLFRWINKIIRYFTSDYHVFFAIVYSFLCYGYIKFVTTFSSSKYSVVPFFLVFYLYLRGFSSIRSNLAICFLLLGIVALAKGKVRRAYLFLIFSALTHKMGIVFGLVIPFCHIYLNRRINLFRLSCLLVVVYFACFYLRNIFIEFAAVVDLGGAYKAYAEISRESGTLKWVNDFGQALMAVIFLIMSGRIKRYTKQMQCEADKRMISILWLVCVFDILMVPVNQLMGIYRGYEFFYLARLSMWSLIIYLVTKDRGPEFKLFVSISALLLFISWFVFRLSRTYEDTCLMPYIFEPLYNII